MIEVPQVLVFFYLLCQHEKVVDNMLWFALKLLPEDRILSCDTHGTGIQVALAHHCASHDDKRSSTKTKFICSQKGCNHHIKA